MTNAGMYATFWVCMTVLGIFFAGDPDIADALIHHLKQ